MTMTTNKDPNDRPKLHVDVDGVGRNPYSGARIPRYVTMYQRPATALFKARDAIRDPVKGQALIVADHTLESIQVSPESGDVAPILGQQGFYPAPALGAGWYTWSAEPPAPAEPVVVEEAVEEPPIVDPYAIPEPTPVEVAPPAPAPVEKPVVAKVAPKPPKRPYTKSR